MQTTLPKLPKKQEEEIKLIVSELQKIEKIEKVILFWSFARWDFVLQDISEENGTTRIYESDYDILVVVNHYKDDHDYKIDKAIKKVKKDHKIERSIDVILESLNHINKMLEENRYFYTDIIKEWILLFDNKKFKLSKAKTLNQKQRKQIQKKDFEKWMKSWEEFFDTYQDDRKKQRFNKSAFELHQAVERYITAYLLVKSWYRPKTHDIEKLLELMMKLDSSFENWFDLNSCTEKEKFELLRKAYVEARYDDNYEIKKEELEFLETKTISLKNLIEKLCKEIIYS